MRDIHNLNISSGEVSTNITEVGTFESKYHDTLNFVVYYNGTMALPTKDGDVGSKGIPLAPGQSATLRFSGPITIGQSVEIIPIVNQTYDVEVVGSGGYAATSIVTAS